MKRKFIAYAMIPFLGAGVLGASQVSAHPLFGMANKATPEEIATRQQEMFQKQADLLGISVDKVKEGWANGKDIMTIATENGITKEQLKQKMKDAQAAAHKSELQALVAKGVITQAQADQRLKVLQDKAVGKGGRGDRGFGRHRGAGDLF